MRIKVLPEDIANKIAAGEVVERPASVVKELLENSIDAESTTISVEVGAGGKRLIRIIDNGIGMGREDALLALERHATSKVSAIEDLVAIRTLGFRGEALPSIASVSQMELITRTADSMEGTKLVVEGGVVRAVQEIGCAQGTRISVNNLFYNVPARLKFLKSESTELSHISAYVTWAALAHPKIQFKLTHNNRTLIDVRPCDSILERIRLLYGKDFAENLMEFTTTLPNFELHSFMGKPDFTKSNRKYQLFFMNLRTIKSKIITAALNEALRSVVPKERYAVAFLFLAIDPEDVDVNVHPAKTEVRFRNERAIYSQIVRSIHSGVYQQKYIPVVATPCGCPQAETTVPGATAEPQTQFTGQRKPKLDKVIERVLEKQKEGATAGPTPETPPDKQPETTASDVGAEPACQPSVGSGVEPPNNEQSGSPQEIPKEGFVEETQERPENETQPVPAQLQQIRLPEQTIPEETELELLDFESVQLKTSLFNTYIVAERQDELFLIDQHIASERVYYERYVTQLQSNGIPMQGLLLPITVELNPAQLALFNANIELFNSIGFDVETFGGNTILVRGIPATLPNNSTAETVMNLIDRLAEDNVPSEDKSTDALTAIQEKALITLACHSAVKAGDKLAMEEMLNLVKELSQTKLPFNCPHARPIIVRMTKGELDSRFKRTR